MAPGSTAAQVVGVQDDDQPRTAPKLQRLSMFHSSVATLGNQILAGSQADN